MYYGYVQQTGMYETLDLVISDEFSKDYTDYYNNPEQWYLSKESENLKDLIEHLWFVYNDKLEVHNIKVRLEDNYIVDISTVKVMFAERFIV